MHVEKFRQWCLPICNSGRVPARIEIWEFSEDMDRCLPDLHRKKEDLGRTMDPTSMRFDRGRENHRGSGEGASRARRQDGVCESQGITPVSRTPWVTSLDAAEQYE
jgi:hypothetical protein